MSADLLSALSSWVSFHALVPCSGVGVISKRASCSLPADDCMVKDLDTTYRRQSS
ncbi:hypothetical protein V1264_005646 [Littorina saxatilis]|uniref:Uncharacterized protein n=1 Tax=Littorina saxatilis TaxID=31220 RepID=A0AAN9B093_9CAEN